MPERELQLHMDRSMDKCNFKIEHVLAEAKLVCFLKIYILLYVYTYTYF